MRLAGVLIATAALFAAGVGVSAFAARSDAPLKAQTYDESIGDAPREAPDLGTVVVSNAADGTITFDVAVPREPVLAQYQSVSFLIDEDNDKSTGNLGFDYALDAIGYGTTQPLFELYTFNGTQWQLVGRVNGTFVTQSDLSFTVPTALLHLQKSFDFSVRGAYQWGSTLVQDDAPDAHDGFFTYTLGALETTTATTATTTTTVTTTPKPKLAKCKKGQRSTAKKRCRRT